ncbi:MAG: amidohydrolase family protein [Geminicoccaceae bacterium]
MTTTVLAHGALFDGRSPDLKEGLAVVVEDGRIKDLAERPSTSADTRVIDVRGRTVMPGLIDAHFHAIAADANLAKLEQMPASLIAQFARRHLEAALMRGFTTVRDAGGADYGLAAAIRDGLIKGPRLFYAGKALSQTGGHGDFRSYEQPLICPCCQGGTALARIADGVTEVRRAARDELRKGASQIKIMASGGVASPSDPIWNLQYSDEEIAAAVWEARAWKTYVMAHAYTAEAIRRCLEQGVRSIEHGNLIDRETAALAKARGAFVVPTLVTYEALAEFGAKLGLPPASVAKIDDVRTAGLVALEHLKEAGVEVGFGSDLLGEMHAQQSREFLIRAEVFSPFEILVSATSGNARLLDRGGVLGEITPGAKADLIVVDGNPLEDLHVLTGQGEGIPLIMRGGEIVKNALA